MRILILTSCTGEKSVTHEQALTLDDFARGGKHLAKREKALAKLKTTAAELYTGQQHVRLMRGIAAVQASVNGNGAAPKVDLWVLSAGYGLVPSDRKLAPYECTFQEMKAKQLREWADDLHVPTDFRNVVSDNYDLALILLGDAYLKACKIDDSIQFGGPTVLFCGNLVAKRLPRISNVRVVTLSNPEASRFSCGLVGLKGEVADRLLSRLGKSELKLTQIADPAFDLLAGLDVTNGADKQKTKQPKRPSPRGNPNADQVIQIPDRWWNYAHREKLRYFIPEWDDLVDPDYDFVNDVHAGGSSDWSNEVYAHQMYSEPNYDGILVSRVVAEKSQRKKARINAHGVHRYLRVPAQYPIMGDCGAFGYISDDEPPYTTDEVLDYYTRLGFDFGVSVDHLIVTATEDAKKFRYDLTINNAEEFLKEHRKRRLTWTPIGAVQGWDPQSYADAAKRYVAMGYKYIGIGGLVRSGTPEILRVLHRVHEVVPADVSIHLFGLARLKAVADFVRLGVRSVDSASYLRQAWMRDSQGYLTRDGSYSAIRIPEIGKSFRAKRMLEESGLSEDHARGLEQTALKALRKLDRGRCSVQNCLDAVMAYEDVFGRDSTKHAEAYRRTLEDKPWKHCDCNICRDAGIEVIIFRGNNRNRRRGFHNTYIFYRLLQATLLNENADADGDRQLTLFPESEA